MLNLSLSLQVLFHEASTSFQALVQALVLFFTPVITISFTLLLIFSIIVYAYEVSETCVISYVRPQILEFKLACLYVYGIGGMSRSNTSTTLYSIEYCDPNRIYDLSSKEDKYYIEYSDEDINALNRDSRRKSNLNYDRIDKLTSSNYCSTPSRSWKSYRKNQYKVINK